MNFILTKNWVTREAAMLWANHNTRGTFPSPFTLVWNDVERTSVKSETLGEPPGRMFQAPVDVLFETKSIERALEKLEVVVKGWMGSRWRSYAQIAGKSCAYCDTIRSAGVRCDSCGAPYR